MISDNYVTGDNIYLRELQNFFFEVLGMMSITHYGAIGDGRRDNYGPIQVAIDDALRRGISFLYVPYGRYIYTGEFTNLIDPETGKQRIIFMGNPHAHIVNIRTGEEITIHQFGWFNGDGAYYTREEADGRFVKIPGDTMTGSLAIGSRSSASGTTSLAVGSPSIISGGEEHKASGSCSFAQGQGCVASGDRSHAEGRVTTASGHNSHAEGDRTVASDWNAHAEGSHSTASGLGSHSEGYSSQATGLYSHSQNRNTIASGNDSTACGRETIARRWTQFVCGIANVEDPDIPNSYSADTGLFLVGNGTVSGSTISDRSNAFKVMRSGDGWFGGNVYVGSTSGKNMDAGSKRLATEDYVNSAVAGVPSTITVSGTTDYTPPSTDVANPDTIPYTTSVSTGADFTLINNTIVVGSGVHYILISAYINCSMTGNNLRQFWLKKNSDVIELGALDSYDTAIGSNVTKTLTFTPKLVAVAQGDVIKMTTVAFARAGDKINGGFYAPYITVQKAG